MARDWWNYSWNVAPGCSKVSTECLNCWAEAMAVRLKAMGREEYQGLTNDNGHWSNRVQLMPERLEDVMRLRRSRVVAVNLMGDLFHPDVPFDFIEKAFRFMIAGYWHKYVVLTKRPERAAQFFMDRKYLPLHHVWIGTSAGTQLGANERWAPMARLAEAGWHTWCSSEPRLEPIDWHGWEFLDQLMTGGESGAEARIMDPRCPRDDRDWCQKHNIRWMFKQWGEWAPLDHLAWVTDETRFKFRPVKIESGTWMVKVGKGRAGHMLDGKEYRQLAWMEDNSE